MIVFKFDHLLHMQYDQVIQLCLDGWDLEETCGIDGDNFIFPLENGMIQGYSLRDNSFTRLQFSPQQREVLYNVDVEEWNVDGDEAQTCRFLLMLVRRSNQIEPYADDYMISVLLRKLNESLDDDALSVEIKYVELPAVKKAAEEQPEKDAEEGVGEGIQMPSKTIMIPVFCQDGEEISMEQFFLRIAMASQKQLKQPIIQYIAAPAAAASPVAAPIAPEPAIEVETVGSESAAEEVVELEEMAAEETPAEEPEAVTEEPSESEAEPAAAEPAIQIPDEIAAAERAYFEKAIQLFDKVVAGAAPGTKKYNAVSFSMGEQMYCRDAFTCAAYFYQQCELELIDDADNFYERLGHCYLDKQMGAYAVPLKLYFKAEQNADFKKSHQEQLKITEKLSPAEIEKYRKLCIKQGKDKYKKQ